MSRVLHFPDLYPAVCGKQMIAFLEDPARGRHMQVQDALRVV